MFQVSLKYERWLYRKISCLYGAEEECCHSYIACLKTLGVRYTGGLDGSSVTSGEEIVCVSLAFEVMVLEISVSDDTARFSPDLAIFGVA